MIMKKKKVITAMVGICISLGAMLLSDVIYQKQEYVLDTSITESYSVEDSGKGMSFCVFVYNVQPGIEIDYKTGESRLCN